MISSNCSDYLDFINVIFDRTIIGSNTGLSETVLRWETFTNSRSHTRKISHTHTHRGSVCKLGFCFCRRRAASGGVLSFNIDISAPGCCCVLAGLPASFLGRHLLQNKSFSLQSALYPLYTPLSLILTAYDILRYRCGVCVFVCVCVGGVDTLSGVCPCRAFRSYPFATRTSFSVAL